MTADTVEIRMYPLPPIRVREARCGRCRLPLNRTPTEPIFVKERNTWYHTVCFDADHAGVPTVELPRC